ncbi:hypothetical protein SO802_001940 [Lithocarpus litseifolius]|uniref:Uncharacterized protein n=1 Tax=Lithocarpus litseifolius TaxID=425828 RepID=A0AAW2E1I7_9ROSI
MKNKPLDRSSRQLRYVYKLHAQLRRPMWRCDSVCGVVVVRACKDGTTTKEEAEGTARTLSSSKSFCSGDLCGGGGGSA